MRRQSFIDVAAKRYGSKPYTNQRPIHVNQRFAGKTLGQVLQTLRIYQINPEKIEQDLHSRAISVDGKSRPLDWVLVGGNKILITDLNHTEPPINPDLDVLHEDDALLCINKPSPLPVHPCGRFNRHSLIWLAKKAWPDLSLLPVHRLDANTTGILLLAKSPHAARLFQQEFEHQRVQKWYLAKVRGVPFKDSFEIHLPIAQTPSAGGARRLSKTGRMSHTQVRVIQRGQNDTTLLKISPRTGRTNQLRLHLTSIGHPIEGDRAYATASICEQPMTLPDNSLCLHAHSIAFIHPLTKQKFEIEAPPPPWAHPIGVD
jgi:UPF0176 protein